MEFTIYDVITGYPPALSNLKCTYLLPLSPFRAKLYEKLFKNTIRLRRVEFYEKLQGKLQMAEWRFFIIITPFVKLIKRRKDRNPDTQ